MNPENLAVFAKCRWPARGLPEAVADEHMAQSFCVPARAAIAILCRCGWHREWSEQAMAYAAECGDRAMSELLEPYHQHIKDVRRLYSPTLADMRDWGWFAEEAP